MAKEPATIEMRICVPADCFVKPWWLVEHVRRAIRAFGCRIEMVRIDPPQSSLGRMRLVYDSPHRQRAYEVTVEPVSAGFVDIHTEVAAAARELVRTALIQEGVPVTPSSLESELAWMHVNGQPL